MEDSRSVEPSSWKARESDGHDFYCSGERRGHGDTVIRVIPRSDTENISFIGSTRQRGLDSTLIPSSGLISTLSISGDRKNPPLLSDGWQEGLILAKTLDGKDSLLGRPTSSKKEGRKTDRKERRGEKAKVHTA